MAAATIEVPVNYTVWSAADSRASPGTLPPSFGLQAGAILYLSVAPTDALEATISITSALSALNLPTAVSSSSNLTTTAPGSSISSSTASTPLLEAWLTPNGEKQAIRLPRQVQVIILKQNDTLLVPYTSPLPSTVDVAKLTAALTGVLSYATTVAGEGSNPGQSVPTTSVGASTTGGVSPGALTGAIIGAALAGILIALTVSWYCLNSRWARRRPAQESQPDDEKTKSSTHTVSKQGFPLQRSHSILTWTKHLPQERDEAHIKDEVESLFEQIELFIEDSYAQPRDRPSAQDLLLTQSLTDRTTHKALVAGLDAVAPLKRILTLWLISRISLKSAQEQCLLPSQYTYIPYQHRWSMECNMDETQSKRGHRPGVLQALSQWRKLIGFLTPNITSDVKYQEEFDAKAQGAADSLLKAFEPWRKPEKRASNMQRDLDDLLKKARDIGLLLFVQATTYVFEWSTFTADDIRSVETRPSLLKTTDVDGMRLQPPSVLLESKIAKI